VWDRLDATFGAQQVVNFLVHEYDQSIEVFFQATIAADWLPSRAQLEAIAAMGFETVYCNFADDTEFVGGWRDRKRRADGGQDATWSMSTRRERVGTKRYDAGTAARTVILRGADVDLFREFLAWKRGR
jgi:hypothetical protein